MGKKQGGAGAREFGTDVVRVKIIGEVDESTVSTLRRTLRDAAAHHPARLEVDLSAATFFARAGLKTLVAASHDVPELVVLDASAPTRKLAVLLGVADCLGLGDVDTES